MTKLLSLIALIPGGGTVVAAIAAAFQFLLSCRICLMVLAGGALWVAGDIHGHNKASQACAARIEADHIAAAKAAQQRDADVAAALEAKYRPTIGQLQKQSDDLQRQVADYERSKLAELAGGHGAACPLGAGALRLRVKAR